MPRGTSGESKIEKDCTKYAEDCGWLVVKLMLTSRNGWPDRQFFKRGHTFFVEFKDRGEPLRRQQGIRHDEIRAAGFAVYVFDSERAFCEFIDGYIFDV